MKKENIKLGSTYTAKISKNFVRIKITGLSQHGGWYATNLNTGRAVRIKTAARLHPDATRAFLLRELNDKDI